MKRSSSSRSEKLQEPKKQKKDNRICIIRFEQHKKGHVVNELTDTSFARIKEVKNLRQNQASKALRYDEICQTIPDQYDTHRWYYLMFTNISHLTAATKVNVEDSKRKSLRRESKGQPTCSISSSSSALFPWLCLFCQKENNWKNRKKETLVKCVTKTAALSILESAKEKEDEELSGMQQKIREECFESEVVGAEEQRAHRLALE